MPELSDSEYVEQLLNDFAIDADEKISTLIEAIEREEEQASDEDED